MKLFSEYVARPYNIKGTALKRLHQDEACDRAYEKSLELNSKNISNLFSIGSKYINCKDDLRKCLSGKNHLERLATFFEAIPKGQSRLKQRNAYYGALCTLGQYYRKQAGAALRKAIEASKVKNIPKKKAANRRKFELQRKVIILLQKAIDFNPNKQWAYEEMAIFYNKFPADYQLRQASGVIKDAFKKGFSSGKLYCELANEHYNKWELEDALKNYRLASRNGEASKVVQGRMEELRKLISGQGKQAKNNHGSNPSGLFKSAGRGRSNANAEAEYYSDYGYDY